MIAASLIPLLYLQDVVFIITEGGKIVAAVNYWQRNIELGEKSFVM
jgi:hypothetical protein